MDEEYKFMALKGKEMVGHKTEHFASELDKNFTIYAYVCYSCTLLWG